MSNPSSVAWSVVEVQWLLSKFWMLTVSWLPKGKSVPNSEKDTEYIPKKEEEELKVKNLDKDKEKTRNGEASFDW